ncbi:hypothetical protein MRB53_023056 [Persea americana]|uniref:Uncharacterized protein n=1 Tax=Persea americana TaxID=3435 RepID=A0ACC2L9B1_PERAE|nr:hypothetical protein MRB53_023056 [Persea americana]
MKECMEDGKFEETLPGSAGFDVSERSGVLCCCMLAVGLDTLSEMGKCGIWVIGVTGGGEGGSEGSIGIGGEDDGEGKETGSAPTGGGVRIDPVENGNSVSLKIT